VSFVLDYVNVTHAEGRLVRVETVEHDDVVYRIRRRADEDHICKEIVVEDPASGRVRYVERLARLTAEEFRFMSELCDMSVEQIYGDYRLHRSNPIRRRGSSWWLGRMHGPSAKHQRRDRFFRMRLTVFRRHAQVRSEHHLRHAERNRRVDPEKLEVALLG
jgi:hypothetical protein